MKFEVRSIKYRELQSIHDKLKQEEKEFNKLLKDEKTSKKTKAKIVNQKMVFVDLRTNVDKSKYSFPYSIVTTREELLVKYEELLTKDKTYIIVDNGGKVSEFVAMALQYFGYDVYIVEGGFQGYRKYLLNERKLKIKQEKNLELKEERKAEKRARRESRGTKDDYEGYERDFDDSDTSINDIYAGDEKIYSKKEALKISRSRRKLVVERVPYSKEKRVYVDDIRKK